MAVVIEAFSVVVRNATLAAKYPGGVGGYRRDCPNNSFCADEHLSRIGFMAREDADGFVAQLAAKGLTPHRKGVAEDVALATPAAGLLRPCPWLEVGRWSQAIIAWLAGTQRGDVHAPANWNAERPMQHMSEEEARRRLEFVRTQDNLDVYRDRETGKELYVGRTARPEADRSRHDALYRQACGLIEGLIAVHGKEPAKLDDAARRRLTEAVGLFEEVVRINPGNWPAMWLLGKIHQRFSDPERSLEWFARSHRVNPDHADVARETAIAAMEAGRPAEAVAYCERAIEAEPGDAGLRANLALALLFSGKPAEARVAAGDALRRDPADKITAHVARIIGEVLAGARPCPRHARDLQ